LKKDLSGEAFGEGTIPAALRLKGSKVSSTGVVMSVYERAGKPTYGSFALPR
jgi:hypothetical protein